MIARILAIAVGYAFGLFQTAYILGRMHGIDIREQGSGNAGTTNALRTLGKKAGLIVLIGDIAKAVAAYFVGKFLISLLAPSLAPILGLYAGIGCILGHCFPFYMGFRGGKGIASIAGLVLAFSWKLFLIGIAVFIIVFLISHYVSLASLLATLAFLAAAIVLGFLGRLGVPMNLYPEMCFLIGGIVAIAWFQHRGNIQRLLTNTERKTYLSKSKE
ncbi:MAG: glycerol-3-phosphate 1-O-acyltransferase PlsY [Lachnospiraceae bacterium]